MQCKQHRSLATQVLAAWCHRRMDPKEIESESEDEAPLGATLPDVLPPPATRLV